MATVLINGRTAVHAASGGTLTAPDVCKTPPKCKTDLFQSIATSADATATATTVLVNGHPVCHAGSLFAQSTANEPGSCGGVTSGTIKGPAEFVTFSPDVLIEGQPAVRQGDHMVSNFHNTPPMPLSQPGGPVPPAITADAADALEPEEGPVQFPVDGNSASHWSARENAIVEEDPE
ncbi:DUF4150 domain-containing protein [Aquisalimonas asiatica]|uniref:PAAR motif-containing protein n=1 Tax=Aquisalimonas asiatica TaxID=406100 RepID=A0A1H8V572_9GAMM|nr:DUF4150 domain-containing protein [Aquisalimonas asiatica]SEP10652.1 PAAR motif-containing protein [Aquisalimonas asiatica]